MKSSDALLDYLAELLCDEQETGDNEPGQTRETALQKVTEPEARQSPASKASKAKPHSKQAKPEKKPPLTPSPPAQAPTPLAKKKPAPLLARPDQEHLAQLEAAKRAELQLLLNHQLPTTTATAPEKPKQAKAAVLTEQELLEAQMRDKLSAPVVEAQVLTEQQLFQQSINSVLEWADNGRPQWAQERFEVLLFDVGGLTLAVPLIALGQIQNIGEELTPIFGQSDWFMGLLNTPQGQVRTVNTALFVMPEKYSDKFLETAKYVISIDSLPWGLAVDSVNQPISLDPADVKWRSSRSSRPWLAGTVKSAMCALIDIPQMAAMLQASESRCP